MTRRIIRLEVLLLLVILGAAPTADAQELDRRIDTYLAE